MIEKITSLCYNSPCIVWGKNVGYDQMCNDFNKKWLLKGKCVLSLIYGTSCIFENNFRFEYLTYPTTFILNMYYKKITSVLQLLIGYNTI